MKTSNLTSLFRACCFASILVASISSNEYALAEDIKFFPSDSKSGPSVKFVFDGKLYSPPKKIDGTGNFDSNAEEALVSFLTANKMGDKNAFISSYSVKDRARMEEFTESELWSSNVAAFNAETSGEILGFIEYGEYIIFVVSSTYSNFEGYSEMLYPLIKESDGEYYVTQNLEQDSFITNYGYQLANHMNSTVRSE